MAIIAVGNAVGPIAALITMPILTYTLGVDGRGQIAAASAPLLLATAAATFGIPEAVTYLVARSRSSLRDAVRRGAGLIVLAGAGGTIACAALAGVLARGDHSLIQLIVIAALALVPTLLVLVLRASAAGLQRWRLIALEQTLTCVLRLVAVAALALLGHLTPLTATVVLAATPVLGGLAYLPLRGQPAQTPGTDPVVEKVRVGALVGYGSRIWVGSLSGVLLSRLDQAIMTPLAGVYQLGLYAAAVSVTDTALILNSAVRDVTFTTHVADRDDERLCASARISATLSLIFCGLIGAAAPLGLPLLFGPGFEPAVPVALWLLAAIALVTPGSIAGAALSARGRPELRSLSLLLACIVNVIALVLLLPHYGAIGAAFATFVGNVIASQLNIVCVSRLTGIAAHRFYGLRRSDVVIVKGKLRDARAALARFGRHPAVAR